MISAVLGLCVLVVLAGVLFANDWLSWAMLAAVFGLVAVVFMLLGSMRPAGALVIKDDLGGIIYDFAEKYTRVAADGEPVRIEGECTSACTLVFGIVPNDRICITSRALLGVHLAYNWKGQRQVNASQAMTVRMLQYPTWLRRWIKRHGGLRTKPIYVLNKELRKHYGLCDA